MSRYATFRRPGCYQSGMLTPLTSMRLHALALGGLLAVTYCLAQRPGGAEPQAQLNSRFQASGLAPGKAFPAVDIFDASGKPFNTARLKGFHTVVVSGCLT